MRDNWEKITLGELQKRGLADIQTGPFGTVLKASEYSNQGVPVVSVGEIRKGFIKTSENTPKVSPEITKKLPQFVLDVGDIVFGRKGAIDRNAIINNYQKGWFLGSDGIRLRLSKEINSVFVSYQLRSKAIGKWLLQNSSGSIMPSLNQKTLDRLPIWLPDSFTQSRIAQFLKNLDAKIALNQRINQELEAMAKLIYDYWFVQFDFPDENGRPYRSSGGKMRYDERLKRDIPEGWEVFQLADHLECNYLSIKKNNTFDFINYLDTSSLTENVIINTSKFRYNEEKVPSRAQRIVQPNDILYSTVRPNQRHFGIIKHPSKNMIASTGFAQKS